MVVFQSPGTFVKEFDFSNYAPALGLATLAIMGGATKGALNTPTQIANEADLVTKFGPPMTSDFALQAAIQYLKQGSRLIFTRVAHGAVAADYPVNGLSGGTPAVAATGQITFNATNNPTAILTNSAVGTAGNVSVTKSGTNITVTGMAGGSSTTKATGSVVLSGQPADADTVTISDGTTSHTFEFDSNSSVTGGNIAVVIGSTATATLANLVQAIATAAFNVTAATYVVPQNPQDGDTVSIRRTIPTLSLQNDAVGALGNQGITTTSAVLNVSGMSGGDTNHFAVGSLSFIDSQQPASGETVTISDGVNTKIFRFISSSGGQITVPLGADAYGTLANLISAINAASTFNVTATNATVAVTFEFDNTGTYTSGHVPVAIGASPAATMANFISAISAQTQLGITATAATITVPRVLLTAAASLGALGNAIITASQSYIGTTGLAGGVNAVPGSVVAVLAIAAKSPGSWGNTIQVAIQATTTMGAPSGNFDMLVYYPVDSSGTLSLVERFNNMSLDPTSSRFVDIAVAQGIRNEFAPSSYISTDTLVLNGSPSAATVTLGASPGNAGLDGVGGLTPADYIGTVAGQTATGLQALANSETTSFNILAIPGITHHAVIDAGIDLVTARGDAIYIIDPPFGLSRDEVIDWHNGVSLLVPNAPTQPLNSSYAALYWSWVSVFDQYNQVEIFLPPSGFVAAAFAYTDANAGPWFAPAGYVLGGVAGDAVEYSPSLSERNLLEGGQNKVNPIVSVIGQGLIILGNNTLQRAPTLLDEVGVRRMLIYVEVLCARATQVLLFQPNDPIMWARLVGLVNPILAQVKAGRGLTKFQIICDKSTNPPDQIARKVAKAKLLVQPTPAAEIIELDFAIFKDGAEFTTSF